MSMHRQRNPFVDEALRLHGLEVDSPSQLSDAFRSGMMYGLEQAKRFAARAPSPDEAHQMGAHGAPWLEAERLAFEAYMRGHCWALCATWDGQGYRSDAEQGGEVDPRAMSTRRLWALWRDRAALASLIVNQFVAECTETTLEACDG